VTAWNGPATSPKVTGPKNLTATVQAHADSTPPRYLMCGCKIIGECVHVDVDAPRLLDPTDVSCPRGARLCGSLTIAELRAVGARGGCCADLSDVAE
jgi:hypothetical protein